MIVFIQTPPFQPRYPAQLPQSSLIDLCDLSCEGRISVLFRGRGMKRCRAKGRERFELFVGAAVLANNLLRIAALLLEKKKKNSRRSKAAA
jgi:hypothetical protein